MPLKLGQDGAGFNARGDGPFNLPFQEQIAFFQQKLDLPTRHYDDILQAQHDRSFVVAGAMKADLLADLRGAVDRAISEGKSIQWFREQFDGIVEKHGWAYKGERDWRTRVIYKTNMSASYAAGRWAQLNDPDLLKSRPYWKYVHNDTVTHPRPLHVAWSGLTLRHDDPWWLAHFPPCGWGCRCRVTAVAESTPGRDTAPDDGTWEKVDRWGEVHSIPRGVDYGWDYAPGQSIAHLLRAVIDKQDAAPWQLARANTQALVNSEVFTHWHNRIVQAALAEADKYTGRSAKQEAARAVAAKGERFPVAVLDDDAKALLGATTATVTLSDYDLAKQAVSRQGQDFTAAEYAKAQTTIEEAQRILRDQDEYTLFIHRGSKVYVAILQRTKSGKAVFLKSFRRSNESDAASQLRKVTRAGGEILKDEW
ncbi:phage minor head protein [Methylogaea oryzae]|uniref:Phage head morphogenesis domain-containing protein n=1 Tax=Methylogaea oryzae TaxID=1295382 RepID=A0A8D4VNJ4_9GAMM|nr:phage minor head protein [Methylogaea oryzae]BBL70337.1 hypothetical protein MoryE10_09430 [Methylogaea oryzae]